MDYEYLASLRVNHPAWRLLSAEHAPLVVSFLHRCFIHPNVRTFAETQLTERLEDYLYHLRGHLGEQAFPRSARDYLNGWADDARGWLRRYYPPDSDEPHIDLTPACEQVLQWLAGLEQRQFVGAESRIKLVFELLQEIAHGSETDPQAQIAQLQRRRDAIDEEIERVRTGHLSLMDPTQLRERFLQAADTARALLADFRQVEQTRRQIGLVELLERHPLQQGLEELVAWLSIATGEGCAAIDESRSQCVEWIDAAGHHRRATLPTVVFAFDDGRSR